MHGWRWGGGFRPAMVGLMIVGGLLGAPAGAAADNVQVQWATQSGTTFATAGAATTAYPQSLADDGVWQFLPTSGSAPELGFVQLAYTASGQVEVHLESLHGSSYADASDYVSGFSPADGANGTWVLVPSTSGAAPELGFIKFLNTGSGTVEVHLESLQNGIYTDVGDYTSDFAAGNGPAGVWTLLPTSGAPELGFIKDQGTPSGNVEVHLDTLQSSVYKRVLSTTSDLSAANDPYGVWNLFGSANGEPILGFTKTTQAGTDSVEPHWDTFATSSSAYRASGAYGSSFGYNANGVWSMWGSGSAPAMGFFALGGPQTTTTGLPLPPVSTTPSSAPATTTPVTELAPAPAASKSGKPKLRVALGVTWTWNHSTSRLWKIRTMSKLPRGTTISFSCRGKHCPKLSKPKPKHRGARVTYAQSIDAVLKKVFHAGDVLTITLRAPGYASEGIGARILAGHMPRMRLAG